MPQNGMEMLGHGELHFSQQCQESGLVQTESGLVQAAVSHAEQRQHGLVHCCMRRLPQARDKRRKERHDIRLLAIVPIESKGLLVELVVRRPPCSPDRGVWVWGGLNEAHPPIRRHSPL